jgi:hypothetical protein
LSVAVVLLAGCNDNDSNLLVSATSDPQTSATTEESDTTQIEQSPLASEEAPDITTYTFSWTDAGGVTIEGTMRLAAPVAADDPALGAAWDAVGVSAPDALECVDNPPRDGVVAGSVSFVNETPDYPPSDVDLNLYAETNYDNAAIQLEYEIHYGNESSGCTPVIWPGDAGVRPGMDSERWGPVPIAFVVSDMYGPAGVDTGLYYGAQTGLAFGPNDNLSPGENMASRGGFYTSFTLPAPDADGDSAGGEGSQPSCESVWLDGQILPTDYAGCVTDDGSSSQDTFTACTDGTTLVQLDGWGYALQGDVIVSDRGGNYHDPALELASNMACTSG